MRGEGLTLSIAFLSLCRLCAVASLVFSHPFEAFISVVFPLAALSGGRALTQRSLICFPPWSKCQRQLPGGPTVNCWRQAVQPLIHMYNTTS